ncbi:hypothetical protein MMC24_006029 [Lignoscripta atroalba]|nr:hypothetical protein [Lignoscripta atroalba]
MTGEVDKRWYEAQCHCAAVRYKINIPNLDSHPVLSCNCSICTKNGYLFVYPLREEVVFHQGYDHLKKYEFGKKSKDHLFCPTCGSTVGIDFRGHHHDGGDKLGINIRLLNDIETDKLRYQYFDGKAQLDPPYPG